MCSLGKVLWEEGCGWVACRGAALGGLEGSQWHLQTVVNGSGAGSEQRAVITVVMNGSGAGSEQRHWQRVIAVSNE